MTCSPLAKRPGLSLLEVLLSLTIMLLAIVALAHLVGVGSDHGVEARLIARASRLTQAKMAEVEAGVVSIQSGGDGTFDGDDSGWSWTVDSQQQGVPNLYQVNVRVSREIRGVKFEKKLTQLLFDPTLMGSASQLEQPTDADVSTASTSSGTGGTGGMNP